MPKNSDKLLSFALLKSFRNSGVDNVSTISEPSALKKLISNPQGNTPSTHSCLSAIIESPKNAMSSVLADNFILQLKKASAKNHECSLRSEHQSCAEAAREISLIIPDSNYSDAPTLPSSFVESYQNHYLNVGDQRKKETCRLRKQKVISNNVKSHHFLKLMEACAEKLDVESTLSIFGRMGRQVSLTEYKTLTSLWIDKARNSNVKESLGYLQKVLHLFVSMRERGFPILEDCYGPILLYTIDMKLKEEFKIFTEFIKDYEHGSYLKIGYYEMLFWIKIGDRCRIKELCCCIVPDRGDDTHKLTESYLQALCENDMKEEMIQLLDAFDMKSISSLRLSSCIFKSLGRLHLENFVEKIILALKNGGIEEENISSFIYDYVSSIPNLAVEDIVSQFEKLHEKFEVIPAITCWDKLIKLSCSLLKVQASLDIADRMCQSGLNATIESFLPILHACEQTSEFDMVHRVYSVICHHNLKPNGDTYKSLIVLCVKMKDFESAYNFLKDAWDMKVIPTAGMYNALMAGYIREKNSIGALKVLRQMEAMNIKPDSETYSYLISSCRREEDITKYYDEMQCLGIQETKFFYMSLINTYANFGNFNKAKKVIQDTGISYRYLNEIKSVLVSALCSNGQIFEALHEYDEIKQAGRKIEPKAAISIIEHVQSEGNCDRLQQLLDDLIDSSYWFDGCRRVVLYCVRHNLARRAVELLAELKKKDEPSTYIVIDQVFGEIWSMNITNLEFGLEMLQAVKEELCLRVSRISLDFLLSTCTKAHDGLRAQMIWSEYEIAGLPHNILTFLRMYQALLAAGDVKAASQLVKQIAKGDPHIPYIIESCKATYIKR